MDCVVSNELRLINVPDVVFKYYKKKLTLTNPEYEQKQRMGFWVGKTPKTLALFKQDGCDLILPYGELLSLKETCKKLGVEVKLIKGMTIEPKQHTKFIVELYDYQQEAVEQMLKKPCGILQAPAGSGKTQMGIEILNSIGHKALWLTHTTDLLDQSYKRAKKYIPQNLLGTITDGKVNIGEFITFATVQTMVNLDLNEYKDVWQTIVVDECHKVCGTPTKTTQFSKVISALRSPYKYGLSATVHRSDGLIQCCYSLLGTVTCEVPDEKVADKIMSVGITRVDTGFIGSWGMYRPDGTIDNNSLISCLTNDADRNSLIVDIANKCEKGVLILSDRVGHLEFLSQYIDNSVVISGKQTGKKGRAERAQAISDMQTGKRKVLLATYSLAKEGLDIPCLENLILATPHKDYAVITQSIGRIARVSPGKEKATCFDLVDDIRYCESSWKKRVSVYKKNRVYFN